MEILNEDRIESKLQTPFYKSFPPNILLQGIPEGRRQTKLFQSLGAIVTFKFTLGLISIQVLEFIFSSLTIPIHCGAQRKSSYYYHK